MRYVLLLVLGCLLAYTAAAQTIIITDQDTGLPLAYVNIASEDLQQVVVSDLNGQADLSPLRWAEDIEISLLGYRSQHTSFAVLEERGFRVALAPSLLTLDQVIVSATRWNQRQRQVPAKVSVITPRKVALENPQTAADLLGSSGEVYIQKSQQGGGSPMIRGFSTNRLLYTIDGVRMNTAIFRGGNLHNVIALDPFAIERTEVFFGPGSIIYGSDAIGAVMSLQTLTPRFSGNVPSLTSGKAITRYASANDELTAHFDVNLGWRKWAAVTSFTTSDFGDLRMGRFGPDDYLRPVYTQRQNDEDVVITNDDPLVQRPSGYSQINLMQKVRFQPNEDWDLQYGFHYSASTDIPRYDRHIRFRSGLPRSAEWNYGPQVWWMNYLNVTHLDGAGWYDQFSLRLAQQRFEESRFDRNFNDTDRSARLERVDAWSVNLDFNKAIGERSHLYYGLEYVLNNVHSDGYQEDVVTGDRTPGPARYPRADWSSYAAYLTYQWEVSEAWLLQAGARYNQFGLTADFTNNLDYYPFPKAEAETSNGALTGSLGVVYRPDDQWSVSANLSTGFRAPNVDDVGKVFDSEPGAVVVPNPDLEAEYAYNGELSLARIFGSRVKVDLAAYYTRLNNALVRRDFLLDGQDSIMYDGELSKVQAIQNAAVARVYGIQAAVEIKLAGDFSLLSQYNYQYGEEELDDGSTSPARHAAPAFGLTRLSYAGDRVQLQLYAVYNAERSFDELPVEEQGKDYLYAADEDGNPYSPAWYTLNLKALYELSDQWSISAGVENLTDQRYRPYSSGLAGAGRNVILALRATF
ncbi:MAG: TonB-dependent receptor [Lewinella sp.]|nr:TonB-dependent receptor [Lewinella sp.]